MIMNMVGGGGSDINGYITNFVVEGSEPISAGDFVQSNDYTFGTYAVAYPEISATLYPLGITALDDDKIAVLYRYNGVSLQIYSINDGVLQRLGSLTQIDTVNTENTGVLLYLKNNLIFCAYQDQTNKRITMRLFLLNSDNSISQKSSANISVKYTYGNSLRACICDNNQICVGHLSQTLVYSPAISLISYSNSTLSVLNTVDILKYTSSTYTQSLPVILEYIGNNKVFIGHAPTNAEYSAYFGVAVISNNSFAFGTVNGQMDRYAHLSDINNNTLHFITCSAVTSGNPYVHHYYLTIATDNTISVECIDTRISIPFCYYDDHVPYYIANLNDNEYVLVSGTSSTQYMSYMKHSFTKCVVQNSAIFTTPYTHCVESLQNGYAISFGIRYINSKYTLYYYILNKPTVRKATSFQHDICGIAMSSGNNGDSIKVITP